MDEYELLGIRRDATAEEIKAAFRRRARELHPDRHVRPDGTVPQQASRSFVAPAEAMRRALAVRSVLDATAFVAARQAPAGAGIPAQRRRTAAGRTPARDNDPMLHLLTLPQRCPNRWSDAALEVWALTMVPAARAHLAEARANAAAAGTSTVRHHTVATAHVLLSRTLRAGPARRYAVLGSHLASAYSTLERDLPESVVDRLPPRVSNPGPRTVTTVVAAAAGAALGALGLWAASLTGLLPG